MMMTTTAVIMIHTGCSTLMGLMFQSKATFHSRKISMPLAPVVSAARNRTHTICSGPWSMGEAMGEGCVVGCSQPLVCDSRHFEKRYLKEVYVCRWDVDVENSQDPRKKTSKRAGIISSCFQSAQEMEFKLVQIEPASYKQQKKIMPCFSLPRFLRQHSLYCSQLPKPTWQFKWTSKLSPAQLFNTLTRKYKWLCSSAIDESADIQVMVQFTSK